MNDLVVYPGIAALFALGFVAYQRTQVLAHSPGSERRARSSSSPHESLRSKWAPCCRS